MFSCKIDGEDEIKDLNRLAVLINKLKEYDNISKEEFEKSLFCVKYNYGNKYYIIINKNVFVYRYNEILNQNHQGINNTNYCYGCSSSIKKGKCHGCHCKQMLQLTNEKGNFYVYKRKKMYRRKLIITQKVPEKTLLHEFWLEQEIYLPYRLLNWLDNYKKFLIILQLRQRINLFPIEVINNIIEHWRLSMLK